MLFMFKNKSLVAWHVFLPSPTQLFCLVLVTLPHSPPLFFPKIVPLSRYSKTDQQQNYYTSHILTTKILLYVCSLPGFHTAFTTPHTVDKHIQQKQDPGN